MRSYDKFPTTTRQPHIGDVWLAKFPYCEKGNMEKVRPVCIADINDDLVKVRMITTNAKKGIKIHNNKLKKDSYLTNNYANIPIDKLYRKIHDIKMEDENGIRTNVVCK